MGRSRRGVDPIWLSPHRLRSERVSKPLTGFGEDVEDEVEEEVESPGSSIDISELPD